MISKKDAMEVESILSEILAATEDVKNKRITSEEAAQKILSAHQAINEQDK